MYCEARTPCVDEPLGIGISIATNTVYRGLNCSKGIAESKLFYAAATCAVYDATLRVLARHANKTFGGLNCTALGPTPPKPARPPSPDCAAEMRRPVGRIAGCVECPSGSYPSACGTACVHCVAAQAQRAANGSSGERSLNCSLAQEEMFCGFVPKPPPPTGPYDCQWNF